MSTVPFLTLDPAAAVTAESLQAAGQLPSLPTLVAEREGGPRRKRIQVWDAAGVGLCVRWDGKGPVAWLQVPRTDGPPWTGEQFARFNRIPLVAA